jgi:hypothetical protein
LEIWRENFATSSGFGGLCALLRLSAEVCGTSDSESHGLIQRKEKTTREKMAEKLRKGRKKP